VPACQIRADSLVSRAHRRSFSERFPTRRPVPPALIAPLASPRGGRSRPDQAGRQAGSKVGSQSQVAKSGRKVGLMQRQKQELQRLKKPDESLEER